MNDRMQLDLKVRPSAGRPTRAQAKQRHEQLLDRALELFLEYGFEQTTIEAVATSLGMTKRTVYSRYPDKSALFKASVQRAIVKWTIPVDTLEAAENDSLEATLIAIARIRLMNLISPAGMRLQHILNAESYRFPEIFKLAYDQGTRPAVDFLTDLLRRHEEAGTIEVEDPEIAATAFLSMVVGGPARGIVAGQPVKMAALEKRIRICVRLFLDGARTRQPDKQSKARKS